MRDLGPGLPEPTKHVFIGASAFLKNFFSTDIVHISARALFGCDEFNLYVFFQHVEGPECQLHGQLGLHTFTSCLAQRTQVSRDLFGALY